MNYERRARNNCANFAKSRRKSGKAAEEGEESTNSERRYKGGMPVANLRCIPLNRHYEWADDKKDPIICEPYEW